MEMNVIASAFAFRPNYGSSTQLGKKNDKEKLTIYIKNIVVSLTSAKLHNPGDEVMLVTNQEPPLDCRKQLEQAGVGISIIPYDAYVMPERFAWSLAFFKLCALTYLARQEYEKILLIDADTITVDAYSELWQEMEYGMMLYPVNHSFHHQARKEIREDAVRLGYGEEGNVIHYGGEFVGGNKAALTEFLTLCESVFHRMEENNFRVKDNIGDETILAVAAMLYKKKHSITEAGAYIYRYWTERRFYLVSSNTIYNPVCIWHLPGEKDKGLIILYQYYKKHGKYPDKKKTAHILGIYPAKRPSSLVGLWGRMLRKQSNLRSGRR